MKSVMIVAAVFSSALLAVSANASVRKSGVIESVDHTNKLMVVTHKNGVSEQYAFAENTRIVVDGKAEQLSALAPSQQVTIAVPVATSEYVRAKIVDVDVESGTAVVQPLKSKESFSVRVTSATKVSGKVSSVDELAKGQTIKIRYADNI